MMRIVALLLLTTTLPLLAQQDAPVVQSTKVTDGIYMLTGRGGNLGLCVGDDGAFLVDDQYAPMTDAIRAAIGKVTDAEVRFVVNTHWHGDHTGGNENFGSAGSIIVAHDNVRERMASDQVMTSLGGRAVPASPDAALPVVTFPDRVTFHLNGIEIVARHFPHAHTDGDTVLFFEGRNVVHMGDIYFNGMYPFLDAGSGGSIDGLIAAVKAVLAEADDGTRIIPGHGPLSNAKELRAYLAMLEGVRDAVGKLVSKGMTREQTVEAKPTAAWDEVWGGGFMQPDVFAGLVWDTLR